uniref:WAPL domain-containing protein n=1 Tax=Romanomermis culicivorax TaxID=13658 RepID=A0A915KFB9_ROMCU
FFNLCLNLLTKASQDFSENRNESGTSPDAKTILNLCLKVLCNITNMNEIACQKLGSLDTFMVDCITLLTDQIPNYFKSDDKFDFSTLTLGLLINLIEPCNSNRKIVISAMMKNNQSAIEALAQAFLRHDDAAKVLDQQVDQQIEIFQSQNQIVSSEFEFAQQVQETLESAVGQAGKHMEDTMIAAHIALFFGLILQQNENVAECIKQCLSNRSFEPLISKLNKLVDFLRLIDSLTSVHENAMFKAIEMLERLSDP